MTTKTPGSHASPEDEYFARRDGEREREREERGREEERVHEAARRRDEETRRQEDSARTQSEQSSSVLTSLSTAMKTMFGIRGRRARRRHGA